MKYLFVLIILFFSIFACQENPFKQGEIMYENFCASCHGMKGEGLRGLVPPLAGADFLKNNPSEIACIIRHGIEGEIVVNGKIYDQPMAAVPQLSYFEITNVINYINQAWGNNLGYYQVGEVQKDLENCEKVK